VSFTLAVAIPATALRRAVKLIGTGSGSNNVTGNSERDKWVADAVAVAPPLKPDVRIALAELLAPAREYLARKAASRNGLVGKRDKRAGAA
jgi:hypothetical protein